mgnify:CR=1 FL=1
MINFGHISNTENYVEVLDLEQKVVFDKIHEFSFSDFNSILEKNKKEKCCAWFKYIHPKLIDNENKRYQSDEGQKIPLQFRTLWVLYAKFL